MDRDTLTTHLYYGGLLMGNFLLFTSGVVMFVFEVVWFHAWWGMGGVIASFLIPPLAAVFPFIFLAKEGFSALYFGIWAVGLVGVVIAGREKRDLAY